MLQIISFNPDLMDQELTTTLEVNETTIQVDFRLKYYESRKKWYLSCYDPETGDPYFLNVPLIASGAITDLGYDLSETMSYKRIGCFWCAPIEKNPSSEHPEKDNLDEFTLYWSDNYD